jgi:hypothetical protein
VCMCELWKCVLQMCAVCFNFILTIEIYLDWLNKLMSQISKLLGFLGKKSSRIKTSL